MTRFPDDPGALPLGYDVCGSSGVDEFFVTVSGLFSTWRGALLRRGARDERSPRFVRWEPAHPDLKQETQGGSQPIRSCTPGCATWGFLQGRVGRGHLTQACGLNPLVFHRLERERQRSGSQGETNGWWSVSVVSPFGEGVDRGVPRLSDCAATTDTACTQTVAHHAQQRVEFTVPREITHTCSQRTFQVPPPPRPPTLCRQRCASR